jgi:arylsulfatase A-like enzyme
MSRPKNLLLIVCDATRRDSLGCYGNLGGITPVIDRFAAEATVCEKAYAASSWTLASMASFFTSVNPGVHQLRMTAPRSGSKIQTDTLHAGLLTLAETLSVAGFQTRCIVANPWLRQFFQVTRGFEHHTYFWKEPAEILLDAWNVQQRELKEPWFVYLHFMDCHAPFTVRPGLIAPDSRIDRHIRKKNRGQVMYGYFKRHFPTLAPEDRQALHSLYLEELRYLDSHLESLLAPAGDRVVILTSDHGEMLGERGYHPLVPDKLVAFGHNKTPYEPLIRVPLIIRVGDAPHVSRLPDPVSHLDLMPTILDMLGVPGPADQMQGMSVAAAFREGRTERREIFAEKLDDEIFPFEERALVVGEWKYIQIARPLDHYLVNEFQPRWYPINHRFGDAYELLGYTMDRAPVSRGGLTRMTFHWRAVSTLKPRLMGMIFFVSQRNREVPFVARFYPVHGTFRPESWEPGRIIEDPVTVVVPRDVPPGDYAIRVGLFDLDSPSTGTPEDAFHFGSRVVGTLSVAEEQTEMPQIPVCRGGGMKRLLQWGLALAGYPLSVSLDREEYSAGSWVTAWIRWRRWLPLALRYGIRIEWIHRERPEFRHRQEFVSRSGVLDTAGGWFNRRFLVQDEFTYQPDVALPDGEYDVYLSVYPNRLSWLADLLQVRARHSVRRVGPVCPRMLDASLELTGFDILPARPVPDEPITACFYWKCHAAHCSAEPPRLELHFRPESSGIAYSHTFSLGIPPAELATSGKEVFRQDESLQLPPGFPNGPCAISLVGAGSAEPLRLATIQFWPEGREPNDVLREELYHLAEDETETRDLSVARPDKLRELKALLERHVQDNRLRARRYQDRHAADVDPEIQSQLAALGYFENA